MTLYLGLGSNLGDRRENLRRALALLAASVAVEQVSSLYETAPVGYLDQPDFLNAVCRASTALPPHGVLDAARSVERSMGRTRGARFGPRIVDVDVLLYGALVLDTTDLTIPHPRLAERAFVLVPLAEIAPDVIHPALGSSIQQLLLRLGEAQGVQAIEGPGWRN